MAELDKKKEEKFVKKLFTWATGASRQQHDLNFFWAGGAKKVKNLKKLSWKVYKYLYLPRGDPTFLEGVKVPRGPMQL